LREKEEGKKEEESMGVLPWRDEIAEEKLDGESELEKEEERKVYLINKLNI
jgi:hypothetical protein